MNKFSPSESSHAWVVLSIILRSQKNATPSKNNIEGVEWRINRLGISNLVVVAIRRGIKHTLAPRWRRKKRYRKPW